MSLAISLHPPQTPLHFYSSSGGNAGLACATAALSLGRKATIVVPIITSAFMISKLRDMGAEVVQIGAHWGEADAYLREELLAKDENGVYVPPFDHPDIWAGNGTIVEELERQMPSHGSYDALVCSVGGGGLFSGIMDGLAKYGRLNPDSDAFTKVLAVETQGANSLAHSLEKGVLARLPAITSIATSLGAPQVASQAFALASSHSEAVTSLVLTDAEAAMASVFLADDERVLVETACGVSVATAYNMDCLRMSLFKGDSDEEFKNRNVVIVVCGGSNVSLSILEGYREKYGGDLGVRRWFGKRALGT
jgi:L-serine/L-threonine ammonia-lyase